MTDLETLRAENTALRAELQQSKELNRKYLQNVAHQLTAPLGAIKWSIEALTDENVPLARKSNLLRSIYSQATILVHLIKNFALMSNLEADHELGQLRGKDEPADLLRLAINLANDFQPQAWDVDKKIVVDDTSFRKALGRKAVSIEKNLIAQALSNLLENAVKYADSKTEITVAVEPAQGGGIGVSVTSVGIPITNQEIDKLLNRGFRGSAAKQKVPAGTGIGLYLANRVMQLHRGAVLIRCRGKQSSFVLLFPATRIT
jgi:two-component system heavy metal sensor histidine kinase CusS